MKECISKILLVVLLLSGVSTANAAPERLAIKNADRTAKERLAKTQIKTVNLQDIEDPAARRAIQQIMNYLGLETQK